ncbi:hypothetical protein PMZ80_003424 [Knufia obscura]|uniref:Fatty acid transporter protein n=2 Tax=Knufia TaxID=430999 RepID=A0AAN8ISY6_9EURO|nr:hypothetical protein PMZ80_003424 [Knufia obscura]KAK5958657.1 hypothetical protein OHC33_000500 [Knufia fluminis]
MALTTAAAGLAAATLGVMYADAKYLIRNDIFSGSLATISTAAQKFTEERLKTNRMLVYHNFECWASNPETASNLFLIFENKTWTYKQFFDQIGRVGNWLIQELNIQKHEIVAIDGGNSPEYLLLWFGLESIGASPAFINCNLTKEPLIHSVKLCQSRYLISDTDVRPLVEPCREALDSANCKIIYFDQALFESFRTESTYGTIPPADRRIDILPTDTAGLIYTSGTTGLPKGTIMLRGREINVGRGTALYLGLSQRSKIRRDHGLDRMYTCLPLYHGAAHGLCVTPSIHAGTTVVLSRKFSHRTLWPEIHASQANILQYVGELCRYLVNAPPRADKQDVTHQLHMAWGNGMRPDVWELFRARFHIPVINELYAATDGMGGSFNNNAGPFGVNAIAKRGLIWNLINAKNEKRIKMDVDTEEIARDSNGFAIEVGPGEPGQVVHRLVHRDLKNYLFRGYYNNPAASEKRWIEDLFEKGDIWFKTGDMMRQDADGVVYFVDRLGDTFRWKSENVSTNEVADVFGRHPQIAETNVVGVQIPHADGRCGLAACVLAEGVSEESVDWTGLARHATSTLPRYAVPIFVRVMRQLDYTGTFKIQKGRLKAQGVDPGMRVGEDEKDSMYWLPPGGSAYVPFRRKEWEELKAGRVKL